MTKQTALGGGLLLVAVLMWISGIGDTISDLQNWHGLTTPAVIGALLKQGAQLALAAVGGTLMPGVGSASADHTTLTVDLQKVGKP